MASQFHLPNYPFLAHPPPQKKRSCRPLPSPRYRSTTFSTIAAWAAHVQPGSPVPISPCSPRHRRLSVGRTRRPSASFIHLAPGTPIAPTPYARDFKVVDLTTLGYTSVFFHLPNTPLSATIPSFPSPAVKPRGLTHFRSLSVLRSRAKSKSACPDTSSKMKAKPVASSSAVVKRKKAKYAVRPPPLINELALMQFADGGSMDDTIKRVVDAQAKAGGVVGKTDVYRDDNGGIWWDQDEEWEYAHLLAEGDGPRPHVPGDLQWVTFGGNNTSPKSIQGEDERRGSVSTLDSDLDPKYMVQPTDSLDGDDLPLLGGAIMPLATRKPVSVLSLPCRPRRSAKHLRKPDFMLDVAFSRLHATPFPKSPKLSSSSSTGISKPKGNARRRPAPLKLSPPSPGFKRPTNSPVDADRVRRDFIEASFEPMVSDVALETPSTATAVPPVVPPVATHRGIHVPSRTVGSNGWMSLGTPMKRKPSVMNMMGLFRSGRKEDDAY